MILAWYAFVAFAGVCIMFTVAHVIGGWLEMTEADRLAEAEERAKLVREVFGVYGRSEARRLWGGVPQHWEPDRIAEMEAVAAAAWGRWMEDETT